ncbi:MAG TPA: alpha/beta hydrolase [Ktedonobacterales bacterium]|nr:alpha/beta hydrolase [Ktedonobacterales bacterium]
MFSRPRLPRRRDLDVVTNLHNPRHPAWLRILRRGVAIAALVVGLAAGLGLLTQGVLSARDRSLYPAPGQLVDVGGYRLHLSCTGSGTPTVIMEAGGGETALSWDKVQPEVARRTRVCAYDRAGLGWSENGAQPRTSRQMVAELRTLLANAKIPPPYIFVAHSFGGLNALLYTSTYPQEVAGLVLVESQSGDIFDRMPSFGSFIHEQVQQLALQRLLAPFGLVRLYIESGSFNEALALYLPADRPIVKAQLEQTRFLSTAYDEERAMEESARQVQGAQRPFGALPLVVITRGIYAANDDRTGWEAVQNDLTRLSTRSVHLVAAHSDHAVMLEQPELVMAAIQGVMAGDLSRLH